jgi:hypothetical protein
MRQEPECFVVKEADEGLRSCGLLKWASVKPIGGLSSKLGQEPVFFLRERQVA